MNGPPKNPHDKPATLDALLTASRLGSSPSFYFGLAMQFGNGQLRAAHEGAALSFPRLDHLAKCQRHRAGRHLSSCVHLSNPATGSASLTAAFQYEPLLAQAAHQRLQYAAYDRFGRKYLENSSHALNAAVMRSWLQRRRPKRWRGRPPSCFVVTVRDPAERLMSAFRESYMMYERLAMSLHTNRKNRTKATASLLVERLRHAFSAGAPPASRQSPPTNTPASLYLASAMQPDWHGRIANYPGPTNGSLFLVSQLWYLVGVNCTDDSETELHVICTERFDADWRHFLTAFGTVPSGHWHRHKRHGTRLRTRAHRAERNSVLSEADKEFVRAALYPWDTALYQWACGGGSQPVAR